MVNVKLISCGVYDADTETEKFLNKIKNQGYKVTNISFSTVEVGLTTKAHILIVYEK